MSRQPLNSPATELGVSPPTKVRWLVMVLACATSFCLYLHRYTWNFVAPELQAQHHWSPTDVQSAYTLFNITYGLGQIPSGVLIDRFGPRLFLSLIIALWSLVIPWQAAGTWVAVALARLGLGATQAGCYPALAQVTARWFPATYRTRIQGLVATVCGRAGGALAPILMTSWLMGTLGLSMQATLILLTLIGLGLAGLFLILFRNDPHGDERVNRAEVLLIRGAPYPDPVSTETHEVDTASSVATSPGNRGTEPPDAVDAPHSPASSSGPPPQRIALLDALRLPSVWMIACMQALVAGVDTIYSSLLGIYFISRGIPLVQSGWLASLPLFGGMLGGLCAAIVNDWLLQVVPRKSLARTGVGLVSNLAAAAGMRLLIQQSSPQAVAFCLAGVKFFADMSQPCGWGACTDIGGRRGAATVFACMNAGGNLGGYLFPILFGIILARSQLLETVSPIPQQDFTPLFTVAACIYLLAGLSWLLIDSSRSLPQGDEA